MWIPSNDTGNAYFRATPGKRYKGELPARGYVDAFGKHARVVLVLDGDKVADMTVRWEFGRVILWLGGVVDAKTQEARMNELKFREWN